VDYSSGIHDIDGPEMGVVIVVITVGVLESLCAVGNNISMERDWVRALITCDFVASRAEA